MVQVQFNGSIVETVVKLIKFVSHEQIRLNQLNQISWTSELNFGAPKFNSFGSIGSNSINHLHVASSDTSSQSPFIPIHENNSVWTMMPPMISQSAMGNCCSSTRQSNQNGRRGGAECWMLERSVLWGICREWNLEVPAFYRSYMWTNNWTHFEPKLKIAVQFIWLVWLPFPRLNRWTELEPLFCGPTLSLLRVVTTRVVTTVSRGIIVIMDAVW
jgi:hypothetical protein